MLAVKSSTLPIARVRELDPDWLEDDLKAERERFPWPADPDEVPVWRLRQERRAREIGITLPRYRTRREFEAAIAECTAVVLTQEAAAKAPDIPWKPLPKGPFAPANPCQLTLAKPARGAPLPPTEAATRFQAWLVDNGHVGAHNSAKLSALYATFCKEANVLKTPENRLRRELKTVPGAVKVQVDKRFAGKGPRPILWEISPVQRRAA